MVGVKIVDNASLGAKIQVSTAGEEHTITVEGYQPIRIVEGPPGFLPTKNIFNGSDEEPRELSYTAHVQDVTVTFTGGENVEVHTNVNNQTQFALQRA